MRKWLPLLVALLALAACTTVGTAPDGAEIQEPAFSPAVGMLAAIFGLLLGLVIATS